MRPGFVGSCLLAGDASAAASGSAYLAVANAMGVIRLLTFRRSESRRSDELKRLRSEATVDELTGLSLRRIDEGARARRP